jgi:hypothetical protein
MMPEALFENGACGSHHGLAATAVHLQEAGYIYADWNRQSDHGPCTDGADHTFFARISFSLEASSTSLEHATEVNPAKALDDEAVRNRLTGLGADVATPVQRSPQYLTDFLNREIARWTPILKAASR